MLKLVTIAALVAVASSVAVGQDVGGTLEGRITAPDRTPLADVEVTVTAAGMLGSRSVITDAGGRFAIPVLSVGRYRVAIRRVGFRPLAVGDVPVRLGETTRLTRLILEPAALVLDELVVSAEAAGLETATTARRLLLDAPQLDALPLDRNYRSVMLLASSAIPSYLGADGGGAGINKDGINVAGATGYENTFYVDGINITSPIRGETSIDLPYNFIQQIQVRTGGATDDDASALGGTINVVTPEGGDQLRGQVFGFFAGDGLQATPRSAFGAYQTGYTFSDIGLSISGPILRKRLTFFAAYDRNTEERENTYAFGQLTSSRTQDLFAARLVWRPGERTSAFVTMLGDPTRSQPLAMPLFGNGVPQNAEVLQREDKANSLGFSLRVQHTVSSRVLLEFAAAQMTRTESGVPLTAAGSEPIVIDEVVGTLYGGHGFAYRFEGRRRELRADVSAHLGPHTLRAGVQFQELYGDITIDISRSGAGGTITRVDTNLYSWHTAGGSSGTGTNWNPAVYVVDTWQVNPRVAVTLGARLSRQDLSAASGTPAYPRYAVADGIQPRAGLIVQPGRLGTQRITLSFARAAEQLPVWGFQDFGTGAESTLIFYDDPRLDPTPDSIAGASPIGIGTPAAPSLRGQTVDEWALGYGRSLGVLAASITVMRRTQSRVVASGLDSTYSSVWGNPGEGVMAHFPRLTRTYDAIELALERSRQGATWYRLSYVLSRTKGNYPGLFGSDWRLGFTNYGPMFIFPEQYVNGHGLLPNDRPHVFKALGALQFGFGLGVGGSLLVASGTPLSEYGAIPSQPAPFRGFAAPRGTSGRTPTTWDLGVRLSYDLPDVGRGMMRSRLLLDVQHIGSPRKAADFEQQRYGCLDSAGNQSCPNASYGEVLQYQPPMSARVGLVVDLGGVR